MPIQEDPYQTTEQEGLIPTSWLLSIFLNPDIYHETDLWTMNVTNRLIDRLIIEGNSSFVLFFFIALLQFKQTELLSVTSYEGLSEFILALPWSLTESDLTEVILCAEEIVSKTPTSAVYAAIGIYSQCSPGLLGPSVIAPTDILYSRLIDNYK